MNCPKRYSGCHARCPDYLREKAEHEEKKAAADKRKAIRGGLYEQRAAAVHKAYKRK